MNRIRICAYSKLFSMFVDGGTRLVQDIAAELVSERCSEFTVGTCANFATATGCLRALGDLMVCLPRRSVHGHLQSGQIYLKR